jgi:3-oxoacyl-[acyl-carrier protein] reductase
MKKLEGKIAVVTGASKGIGASIAKHLAAEGAAVVVNYASSKEGADRVVDEIATEGGKAIAIQADVAKKTEIERLFAQTQQTFGQLDILVDNAGIYEFAPLADITEEHFHKQFDLNVLGLILTTQSGVKRFGSEGGNIINISSISSTLNSPTTLVYSATKAAVDAITKSLAKELGSRHIRVNAINPGMARTSPSTQDRVDRSAPSQQPEANKQVGVTAPVEAADEAKEREGEAQDKQVPTALTNVGNYGEALYDTAKAGDWTKAAANLRLLQRVAGS